jgi:PAS domain S-box-containing protein
MIIDNDQIMIAAAEMRHRAEKELVRQGTDTSLLRTDDETQRLLQELQIHQVELEMQNTELRQARDEVENGREKYSDLYDFAPVGYMTLDGFGAICSVNLTGAALLGIDRARLIGRSFTFFVTAASRPLFSAMSDKVFTKKERESCEITLTTAGGLPLFVQIEAMIAPSKQECRMAIIDISGRKKLEGNVNLLRRDLDSRAAELATANCELQAFNFTISHFLRSPLTVINSYCQLLQDQGINQLDMESQGYLQEIYDGTRRMNHLIDVLLKFSSVTRVEMHQEKIDLSKLVAAEAQRLEEREPERQVLFRIGEGIMVTGDFDLLRLVISHLLNNAWKIVARKKRACIEFGVATVDGKTACFVRDNGPGFPVSLAEQLFIPFQRLPGHDMEGVGIGLATVDRIVKRHGGEVWAESQEGKGATFFFTLATSPSPAPAG